MKKTLLILSVVLITSSGCRWGAVTKREQEECCPTDIRQKHCWCWGEDAIFDTPCCPDEAYHGHKPTCWREWQAPASVWRDERCGPPVAGPCSVVNMSPLPHPGIEVIDQPTSAAPELAPPQELRPADGIEESGRAAPENTDVIPEVEEDLGPLPELDDLDPPQSETTPRESNLRQPTFALQASRQTVYRASSNLGGRERRVTFASGPEGTSVVDPRPSKSPQGYVNCEARRLPPLMGFEVVR